MYIKNIELGIDTDKVRDTIREEVRLYCKDAASALRIVLVMVVCGIIGSVILSKIIVSNDMNPKIIVVAIWIILAIFTAAVLSTYLSKRLYFKDISFLDFLEIVAYCIDDESDVYADSIKWLYNCPNIIRLNPNFMCAYTLLYHGNWTCRLRYKKKGKIIVNCIDVDTKTEMEFTINRSIVDEYFSEEVIDNLVLLITEDEFILYDKNTLVNGEIIKEFKR